MSRHMQESQHTFVVRFWWEWERGESTDQTMGWRGRIQHVQSGEGITFREMNQLLTFIEGYITPLPSPPRD
ncbi:hypothetical protein [uncultured Thermanaerothrix sp.]|uniref:hypothetical protein n=1 Tax=uncultured Thermanaerothrix sp. TaxID=1195149 RepID=UPI0026348B57|nr:hypothetical protein [uncultured Thermanaerothrix sp.]